MFSLVSIYLVLTICYSGVWHIFRFRIYSQNPVLYGLYGYLWEKFGAEYFFLIAKHHLIHAFGCKSNAKVDFYTWNFLFNMYFCGVLIYMMFNSNSEFATRGSGYFKILELVILPLFIYVSRGLRNKLLIWFLL